MENKHLIVSIIYGHDFVLMDQLSIVCIASTMESTFQAKWLNRAVLFPICYVNFIITLRIWNWKLHSSFFFHALLFWHFIFKSSHRKSWQKNLGGSLLISLWGQNLEKQVILPSRGSRALLFQQGTTQEFPESNTNPPCFACTLGQISHDISGPGPSNRHKSVIVISPLTLQAEALQTTRATCQCFGWLLPKTLALRCAEHGNGLSKPCESPVVYNLQGETEEWILE